MPRYTKKQIKTALEQSRGQVYIAARSLSCSPNTIYDWMEKNDDLMAIRDFYRGQRIDTAELKLDDAMLAGEAWAIAFILKTIGKDRGYVEANRTEHTGPDGGDITIRVVYDE